MNKKFISIKYKNVEYEVNLQKLKEVLSRLENKNIEAKSDKDYKALLKKYKLYDEGFFENINNA